MVSGGAPKVYTVHRRSGSKAKEFLARSLHPHCTNNGSLAGENPGVELERMGGKTNS